MVKVKASLRELITIIVYFPKTGYKDTKSSFCPFKHIRQ